MARIKPSLSLRFDDKDDERGFQEFYAPRIRRNTFFAHSAVLVCYCGVALWAATVEIALSDAGATTDGLFPGTMAVLLLADAFAFLGLAATSRRITSSGMGWEQVSFAWSFVNCLLLPWLYPRRLLLLGLHADDRPPPRPGLAGAMEATLVFLVASNCAAHVGSMSLRWPLMMLVYSSSVASFALAVALGGSPLPDVLPPMLIIATTMLVFTAISAWLRERDMREWWRCSNLTSPLQSEPAQGAPDYSGDLVVRLDEEMRITDACLIQLAVFGGLAEGRHFTDFLPDTQRQRFEEFIRSISSENNSGLHWACFTIVNSSHMPFDVDLAMVSAASARRQEGDEGATGHIRCGICLRFKMDMMNHEISLNSLGQSSVRQRAQSPTDDQDQFHAVVATTLVVPPGGSMLNVPVPTSQGLSSTSSRRGSGSHPGIGEDTEFRQLVANHQAGSLSFSNFTDAEYVSMSCSSLPPMHPLRAPVSPMVQVTGTQTEPMSQVEQVEQGVNTSLAMDGFTWKCTACAKPPKPPSREQVTSRQIQQLSKMRRGKRRRSKDSGQQACGTEGASEDSVQQGGGGTESANEEEVPTSDEVIPFDDQSSSRSAKVKYKGHAFDGTWVVPELGRDAVGEWLQKLYIYSHQVIMGNGRKTNLYIQDDIVILCGGETAVQGHVLTRKGTSGIGITLVREDGGAGSSHDPGDRNLYPITEVSISGSLSVADPEDAAENAAGAAADNPATDSSCMISTRDVGVQVSKRTFWADRDEADADAALERIRKQAWEGATRTASGDEVAIVASDSSGGGSDDISDTDSVATWNDIGEMAYL